MNSDPYGFVETPPELADWLAAEVLLTDPSDDARILYPGAGTGNIAAAVHRHCSVRGIDAPDAVAVENHPERADALRERFVDDAPDNHGVPELTTESVRRHKAIRCGIERSEIGAEFTVHEADFLTDPPEGLFDYIVANPPYTAYPKIDAEARTAYRDIFETAVGRYPLHAPFVEQMLNLLKPDGVLVFLAPFSWLTTGATKPLRRLIRNANPATSQLVPECGFPDHQVVATLNVVARPGASWMGETDAPSETRLDIVGSYGRFVEGVLQTSERELEDAWTHYRDMVDDGQLMLRHRDRKERKDFDSVGSASRSTQRSLDGWVA